MEKLNLTEATIKALEGKLLEDDENKPIEGQYSFEDIAKGTYIYETPFSLVAPVNDLEAAQAYLEEDNMVEYLDKERCSAADDIKAITWILEDEESGVIRVNAIRELTEEELDQLSDWISGQCSDGLGEGFEQQDFAESYFNPVTGDGPYNRREVEREVERLYEDIDTNTLIENGYLDNEIWEAVENYKDENSNYDEDSDEELSDDEIYDIIVSDPDSYLDYDVIEDARQKYADGDDELDENNWYVMASFDWKTNKYKLHQVN